jgi:hypothetical protein
MEGTSGGDVICSGRSCVLSIVSTCSARVSRVRRQDDERTQSGFQQLDVATLRTALLAHLIIAALVRETAAGATFGAGTVASKLALSTENASHSLYAGWAVRV